MFQLYPTHNVTDQFRELARELESRLNTLEGTSIETPVEPHREEEVING
jgi:hypothetical protein